jgi:opacity protein-like surface antigen
MKRVASAVLSSLLFVAFASVVRAQGVGTIHFGLSGGADFPIEDQSSVYKTGWNGTFLMPINFGASPISIRLDGSYHELQTKDLTAFVGTGRTRIISGTADVVIGPRGLPVEPYFLGGVGAYDLRFHGEDVSTGNVFSDSSTRFGWNAGGGLAFPLGPSSASRFFVEARYTSISVNADRFTNSVHTGGSRFTIIPVNLGFIF